MTIRTKFATGLIFILVVNLMAGLYAFGLYQKANSQASEVREASSQIVALALTTQVRFKKQVQEWKNILLRGQDPALFDRYLAQFEQEEENTRASMRAAYRTAGGEPAGTRDRRQVSGGPYPTRRGVPRGPGSAALQ